MRNAFLVLCVCCMVSPLTYAATDHIPEPNDPVSIPASKVATPPDINAVLAELLKRMPTPAEMKTPAEKENWNDTIQTLSKELIAIAASFMALWKLLHDDHDRKDERAQMMAGTKPVPTPEEKAVLERFGFKIPASGVVVLFALCLLSGCGETAFEKSLPAEPNCPGETHEYQDGRCEKINGKWVCK